MRTTPAHAGLAAAVASLLLAMPAAAGSGTYNRNDEGLTSVAAFRRIVGAPMAAPAAAAAYVPPVALVFDDAGRSNELIITLAYANKQALRQIVPALSDSASRATVEGEVVNAVRRYDRDASFALQSPLGARLLTETSRLSDTDRAELASDHPRERLERYLIVRYSSVAAALQAQERLRTHPALASVANNRRVNMSWAPNDPYFAIQSDHRRYQWGLHEMNFPAAWDVSTGHGYVGVLEPGVPNALSTLPPDAQRNHRAQFAFNDITTQPLPHQVFHANHVLGILGATTNNGAGIGGACPTCSTALLKIADLSTPEAAVASLASSLSKAIERGMQVVNWSGGYASDSASYPVCGVSGEVAPICDGIAFAHRRKVLVVSAAGNGETDLAETNRPQFPGELPAVVAVGGAEEYFPAGTSPDYNQQPGNCYQTGWCQWVGNPTPQYDGWRNRSNAPGVNGVYAPARSVVSTVPSGDSLHSWPDLNAVYHCSDTAQYDESGNPGDGYGSCTGTSMAAPHIAALAGILRSINPLLPALPTDHLGNSESRMAVRSILHSSGTHDGSTARWGYGMPNAATAVATAVAQTPNRLTPLFSFYSPGRTDYFYTTVPQMATAALKGTMMPLPDCVAFPCVRTYNSKGGTTISGYPVFPDSTSSSSRVPKAEVWVFTTPLNPKDANLPLVPLYRFSWKCGEWTPYPPAACSSYPMHMDTVYSADPVNGISFFEGLGYKLDGIEGYIYPRTMAQPAGTLRLMRRYNPALDDHALFPESQLSAMLAAGYTEDTGNTDWIGYVYPNTNGSVPAIQ